jgi:hypothetical protein
VVDFALKIHYTELNLIIERTKDSREIALNFTIVTKRNAEGDATALRQKDRIWTKRRKGIQLTPTKQLMPTRCNKHACSIGAKRIFQAELRGHVI